MKNLSTKDIIKKTSAGGPVAKYTAELKDEAIKLAKELEVADVAKSLEIPESTLRGWIRESNARY